MNLKQTGKGPDEFGILPPKPLEMPKTWPNCRRRRRAARTCTDPTREADAIVALGGDPARRAAAFPQATARWRAMPARYGVTPDIRQHTGRRGSGVPRATIRPPAGTLFNVNVYYKAYKP